MSHVQLVAQCAPCLPLALCSCCVVGRQGRVCCRRIWSPVRRPALLLRLLLHCSCRAVIWLQSGLNVDRACARCCLVCHGWSAVVPRCSSLAALAGDHERTATDGCGWRQSRGSSMRQRRGQRPSRLIARCPGRAAVTAIGGDRMRMGRSEGTRNEHCTPPRRRTGSLVTSWTAEEQHQERPCRDTMGTREKCLLSP